MDRYFNGRQGVGIRARIVMGNILDVLLPEINARKANAYFSGLLIYRRLLRGYISLMTSKVTTGRGN